MKKIEIESYNFGELEKKIQDKIIEKFRYVNVEDSFWYELILENFETELEEKGFIEPEIYYSGFGSQGDGLCFDCKSIDNSKILKNINMKENEKKIMKTIMENDFHISIVKNSYGYHYSHSNTRYIIIDYDCEAVMETLKEKNIPFSKDKKNIVDEFINDLNNYRKELCRKFYNILEKEYFELIKDESIVEFISCNDFIFNKYGEIIRL